MKHRQALFEAKRFVIHGLATALYGEDRSKLHPKIQEVLLRMELLLHNFITEFKDAGCSSELSQSRNPSDQDREGNKEAN